MGEVPLTTWLTFVVLVLLSGSFSASETALFSLERHDLGRCKKRVGRLLQSPRDLLVTILLGNLLVNVFFFALAARLSLGDLPHGHLISAVSALVVLLIMGEILPKTIALRAPVGLSNFLSIPLTPLVATLAPLRKLITGVLEVALRALGEAGQLDHAVTSEMLAGVLERSAGEGTIASEEANMLAEIVELGGTHVREIMTPRVDTLMLDIEEDPEPIIQSALARGITWLPVTEGGIDQIIGSVRLRNLLRRKGRDVRSLLMPVKFVPEVSKVLALLHELREDRAAEAVAVDEWGGTAGVVTIEDIFEEIVGELRVEGEARETHVIPLGEGRFRVHGGLSIRDWNDEFGLEVVPNEFETVGGFVTALLGRIPRTGDRVRSGDFVYLVHEMRGRRVLAVDMWVSQEEEQQP